MGGVDTASLPDGWMIVYDCFDQERASDASEFGWDAVFKVTQVTPRHPRIHSKISYSINNLMAKSDRVTVLCRILLQGDSRFQIAGGHCGKIGVCRTADWGFRAWCGGRASGG